MSAPGIVHSGDGTAIAYRESGSGPGVVLLHGAMQSSRNFTTLAHELSASFRVYVPDRRGRGGSGPHGPDYSLTREVEDLEALLHKTEARFVFGLSSGALVALAAARTPGTIERLAVHEPPFTVEGADPAAWVPRYLREIGRGRLASAMVTALKGAGDVELMTYIPRVLLTPLVWLAIRADAANQEADRVPIRALIPTARYDAIVQREATLLLDSLVNLDCALLLIGGTRSHRALRASLDAFAARLPKGRCVRLARAGHIAADDVGHPRQVAEILRTFFG
jgi:pimeloyl-ACP methyl ester carboxylesterase